MTIYQKLRRIVKNHNIRIKTNAQVALALLQADLLSGVFAAPAHDFFDAEVGVALRAFRPENG